MDITEVIMDKAVIIINLLKSGGVAIPVSSDKKQTKMIEYASTDSR